MVGSMGRAAGRVTSRALMAMVLVAAGGCGGGAGGDGNAGTPPPPTPGCPEWSGTLDLAQADHHSLVTEVAVVDACSYLIAGYERSSHAGEPLGNARGFVRRVAIDPAGNLVARWSYVLDTSGADAVTGMRVTGGQIRFWGTTDGAIEGYASAGEKDVVLGVLDVDGRLLKLSQLGNEKPNVPVELLTTESGELLLVGRDEVFVPTNFVESWEDPWLASVTEHADFFALNWIRNHETAAADWHTAAVALGETVLTAIHGDAGPARGAVLERRDATGGLLWSLPISSGPYDQIGSLHLQPGGASLLALGTTYGRLGDTPVGDADLFIAEVDPELGTVTRIRQFGTERLDWATRLLVSGSRRTVLAEVLGEDGSWWVEAHELTPAGAIGRTGRIRLGSGTRATSGAHVDGGLLVGGSFLEAGRARGYLRLLQGGSV